jgi:hypothetical protein
MKAWEGWVVGLGGLGGWWALGFLGCGFKVFWVVEFVKMNCGILKSTRYKLLIAEFHHLHPVRHRHCNFKLLADLSLSFVTPSKNKSDDLF